MKKRAWASIAVMSVTLSACGGGGDDGAPAASTKTSSVLTFPLAQAFADFVANGHTFNFDMSATVAGVPSENTATGTVTYGAATSGEFEGQSVLRQISTITGNVSNGTTTLPYSDTLEDFYTTNYQYMGSNYPGSSYCVARDIVSYPQTVEVGDTGTLGVEDCYADSTKLLKVEDITMTYVIEAETATTVIFNAISTDKSTSGTVTGVEHDRFRITETGGMEWVSGGYTDYSDSSTITVTVK